MARSTSEPAGSPGSPGSPDAAGSAFSPRAAAWLLWLAGYAVALAHGQLYPASLPWLALLIAAGLGARQHRWPWLRPFSHGLLFALGVALALHLLPGFGNAPVMQQLKLGELAAPYSFYLNLDKPLIGLWLLWVCPWIVGVAAWPRIAGTVLRVAPPTILGCLAVAWLLQWVGWDPKWPPQAWLWLANNVLLVCVVEEALFRGYLMGGLLRAGGVWARMALPLSALLFGLAHLAGGWPMVLLATLAGLGYGWAWRRGGLLAAVAVHASLNLVHFGLFTYPMRMPL